VSKYLGFVFVLVKPSFFDCFFFKIEVFSWQYFSFATITLFFQLSGQLYIFQIKYIIFGDEGVQILFISIELLQLIIKELTFKFVIVIDQIAVHFV